jgi:hypothetical protein
MILAFSGYLSNLVILGLPNRCHPNMGAGGALLVTEERIPRIEMFKIELEGQPSILNQPDREFKMLRGLQGSQLAPFRTC